jgi:hypothetical protein
MVLSLESRMRDFFNFHEDLAWANVDIFVSCVLEFNHMVVSGALFYKYVEGVKRIYQFIRMADVASRCSAGSFSATVSACFLELLNETRGNLLRFDSMTFTLAMRALLYVMLALSS